MGQSHIFIYGWGCGNDPESCDCGEDQAMKYLLGFALLYELYSMKERKTVTNPAITYIYAQEWTDAISLHSIAG